MPNIPPKSLHNLSSSYVNKQIVTDNSLGLHASQQVDLTSSSDIPFTPSALKTGLISEALFVRILVERCKRIAPLWFRGVSSMREKNREENRRTASNSGQTQNDWTIISDKINEMNQAMETDTVINLLKKLYKELPSDSVLWFVRCWLRDSEAMSDSQSCVLSRPDAKGRMRRIDGGKGSDKVWRLDTIVGMLYHGLPMSSTDTNIMMRTCNQELCVRPQHIRFRASSVALVVVLKALSQAGYAILPPRIAALPTADESVDVFGPFSIEQLQRYRSENLCPSEECMSKLGLNATDCEISNSIPVIREMLQHRKKLTPFSLCESHLLPACSDASTKACGLAGETKPVVRELVSSCHSRFLPASSTGPLRKSLKRPYAAGSPLGLTPSRYSEGPTTTLQPRASCSRAHPNNLDSEIAFCSNRAPDASQMRQATQPAQLPAPKHFTRLPIASSSSLGDFQGQPIYAPQPINGRGPSGKSTPRQPAKKRLEARTPTIEGFLEDTKGDLAHSDLKNEAYLFHLQNDTSFIPVLSPSEGIHLPSAVSTQKAFQMDGTTTSKASRHALSADIEEDEELASILSTRRSHSLVEAPYHHLLFCPGLPAEQAIRQDSQNHLSLHSRFSPPPPKRSASASLLPHLGGSPSPGPRQLAAGATATAAAAAVERPLTGFASPAFLKSEHHPSQTPPPPRLLSSQRQVGERNPISGPQQDYSFQDWAARIRDSPACGANPEIIEMLVSMAQQYGVQHTRLDGRNSRPTSQQAQRIFRSFLNGDSPSPAGFPLSLFNSLSSATPLPGVEAPAGAADGLDHLRSLSFTPFSVDSDLNLSLTSTTDPPSTSAAGLTTLFKG